MSVLIRQNSADRIVQLLSVNTSTDEKDSGRIDSSIVLQQWWRRRIHYNHAVSIFRTRVGQNLCKKMVDLLGTISDDSFVAAQSTLTSGFYTDTTNVLINSLPLSPPLHAYKTSMQLCRLCSTAVLIHSFPAETLVDIDDSRDASPLANKCFNAAGMLLHSLAALFEFQDTASVAVFTFRYQHYMFSLRYFAHSLHGWKMQCNKRVAQSLELPYVQCYAIYLVMLKDAETRNCSQELKQADAQCDKIRKALSNLLGVKQSRNKMDELEAYAKSCLIYDEGESLAEGPSSPAPGTAAAAPSTATTATDEVFPSIDFLPSISTSQFFTPKEMQMLQRVSQISNVESLSLVHSITSHYTSASTTAAAGAVQAFQLPPCSSIASFTTSVQDGVVQPQSPDAREVPTNMEEVLRSQMLLLVHDELISSLRMSKITTVSDVSEGSVVYVYETSRPPLSTLTPQQLETVLQTLTPAQRQGLRLFSAEVVEVVEGSNYCTVRYMVDKVVESKVSLHRIKLTTDLPNPSILLRLLGDVRGRICSIRPDYTTSPQSPFFHSADSDKQSLLTDDTLFSQMISHQSMSANSMATVLNTYFTLLLENHAPIRCENHVLPFKNHFMASFGACATFDDMIPLLPMALQYLSASVDELFLDMANYYLQMLSQSLAVSGLLYLSATYNQAVRQQQFSLRCTAGWLWTCLDTHCGTTTTLSTGSIAAVASSSAVPDMTKVVAYLNDIGLTDVTAKGLLSSGDLPKDLSYTHSRVFSALAYLHLLQTSTHRLNTPTKADHINIVPETLVVYVNVLSELRDEIDVLCVKAALVFIIRQVIVKFNSSIKPNTNIKKAIFTADIEETLYHRLEILLRDKNVHFPDVVSEVKQCVVWCIQGYVSTSEASDAGTHSRPAAEEWASEVTKACRDILSPTHPILALFYTRIYKLMMRGLCGQSYTSKLVGYSLHSKSQTASIHRLVSKAAWYFEHTWKVHGEIYHRMIMFWQQLHLSHESA